MELTRLDDSVSTGIKTEKVHGRYVRDGYRVSWIEWDSAFRDTDLRIGDLVVACNGEAYVDVHDGNTSSGAVGMYGESRFWELASGKEGNPVVLRIVRDGVQIDIESQLRAYRFYSTADGKRAIAPGGPEKMRNDGFSGAWSSWYESTTKAWSQILDDGWNRGNLNNRKALAEHLEEEARIRYLQDHYPGPFANCMRTDHDRVIDCLRGKKYELGDDDLAYRELGEKRAEVARQAAQASWRDLLGEIAGESIAAFPAVDPDLREEAAGRIVELPWITPRQIINDLGNTYAVFGSSHEGYYFIDCSFATAQRFFTCFYRYVGLVNPGIRERYSFVARILAEPRMITWREQPVTGLLVEVLAGRAGDGEGEMFADLRGAPPDRFAGEEDLRALVAIGELADDFTPERVVETMIRAVQQADMETWKKTFADWRAWARKNGEVYLNRAYALPEHSFGRPWEHSRRNLTKEVYDSRVSSVTPVVTLAEENTELGTPGLEQVTVYVDHIGLFDGEYRPFNNVNVTRPWTLQRIGDGPWRITDVRHL